MEKAIMARIEASGLFSTVEDEPSFSRRGCEHPECREAGKGATVYQMRGYTSLEDARKGEGHSYEFQVCGECLIRMNYGEGR